MRQESGRGRQGRAWVAAAGNFYGSTLVRLRPDDPAAPTLSLAAGLSLIETIDVAAPGEPVMLKWPNDVLLSGKKLAGILLERSGDRVVAGFGVNLAIGPDLGDRRTADLRRTVDPKAFAPLLAASFTRWLDFWRSNESSALVRAWERRAHLPGTKLVVHVSPNQTAQGRFGGLEPDGALRLVRDDATIEVIRAGDVEL